MNADRKGSPWAERISTRPATRPAFRSRQVGQLLVEDGPVVPVFIPGDNEQSAQEVARERGLRIVPETEAEACANLWHISAAVVCSGGLDPDTGLYRIEKHLCIPDGGRP